MRKGFVPAPLVTALGATVLSSGCLGLCLEHGLPRQPQESEAVFVTNPGMKEEYEILRSSGIYEIKHEPAGVARLTLEPVGEGGSCGNPAIAGLCSLGLIPVRLPPILSYTFAYQFERKGVAEHRVHFLPVYERFSIWEGLWRPWHGRRRILSKALERAPAYRSTGDRFRAVPVHPDRIPRKPTPVIQRPKGPL